MQELKTVTYDEKAVIAEIVEAIKSGHPFVFMCGDLEDWVRMRSNVPIKMVRGFTEFILDEIDGPGPVTVSPVPKHNHESN